MLVGFSKTSNIGLNLTEYKMFFPSTWKRLDPENINNKNIPKLKEDYHYCLTRQGLIYGLYYFGREDITEKQFLKYAFEVRKYFSELN